MRRKAVLVTGGTGGLGIAVTRAAHAAGGEVTASYIVDAELEPARAAVAAEVRFVKLDVGDEAAVAATIGGMPRLDVLIHLVGGFAMSALTETAVDDFRRQLELNLVTAFVVCKHALAKMQIHDYGRIVTVGTRTAVQPAARTAAYAASKAGVIALTQAIADETRGSGITANCVLPSIIDTPANRRAMPAADTSRWVAPDSLAQAICFLASDGARDLRGAAVPVYGSA